MSCSDWLRVTKQTPCPICGKRRWCGISRNGEVAHCMRVRSDLSVRNGGWIHRLAHRITGSTINSLPRKTDTPPVTDFTELHRKYRQAVGGLENPAERLGVTVESLDRLGIGYDGRNYTFPMHDNKKRLVGIRIRTTGGRKWSVRGSRNALFWPAGVACTESRLIICEGPTDCAALLTLGFDAIGRPSCMGGVKYLCQLLRAGPRRPVVIMADRDSPKRLPDGSTWRPGRDGAVKLARQIKPLAQTVKLVKPPKHKDIRQWLMAGATKAGVEVVINNTKYYAEKDM